MKKLLEGVLKLKANEEKSSIRKIEETTYLGYGFYLKDGLKYKVPKERVRKLKSKLKEITSRSNGWSHEFRKERLNQVIGGCVQYSRLASRGRHLTELDELLRWRLRMCT